MSNYGIELTVVPRDLYYVERALVERQAAEIKRLREQIEDAELALNVYDHCHDSEYWARHPRDPGDLIASALGTPKEQTPDSGPKNTESRSEG